MRIVFHQSFRKDYKKLPPRDQAKFDQRVRKFLQDPFHPILENHSLRGIYGGCRSISVKGDLRAVYVLQNHDTVALFVRIGTHSQLYG